MATTQAKPVASPVEIEIPDDATLVHISVKTVDGHYTLGVFPSRRGDTRAFYTEEDKAALRSPERPREVVWVAHDLPDQMKLVIAAKPKVAGMGLLAQDQYTIEAPARFVTSQAVLSEGIWSYNIFLRGSADSDSARPLASIDPDIVIHPDP